MLWKSNLETNEYVESSKASSETSVSQFSDKSSNVDKENNENGAEGKNTSVTIDARTSGNYNLSDVIDA